MLVQVPRCSARPGPPWAFRSVVCIHSEQPSSSVTFPPNQHCHACHSGRRRQVSKPMVSVQCPPHRGISPGSPDLLKQFWGSTGDPSHQSHGCLLGGSERVFRQPVHILQQGRECFHHGFPRASPVASASKSVSRLFPARARASEAQVSKVSKASPTWMSSDHMAVLTCWSRIAFRIPRREASAGSNCKCSAMSAFRLPNHRRSAAKYGSIVL